MEATPLVREVNTSGTITIRSASTKTVPIQPTADTAGLPKTTPSEIPRAIAMSTW